MLGDYLFLVPALVFVVAILLYPLGYELYMSVHNVSAGNFLAATPRSLACSCTGRSLSDPAFAHSLLITVIYTVSCLVFQFTIGFALALFFNRPSPATGCCARSSCSAGCCRPSSAAASSAGCSTATSGCSTTPCAS